MGVIKQSVQDLRLHFYKAGWGNGINVFYLYYFPVERYTVPSNPVCIWGHYALAKSSPEGGVEIGDHYHLELWVILFIGPVDGANKRKLYNEYLNSLFNFFTALVVIISHQG